MAKIEPWRIPEEDGSTSDECKWQELFKDEFGNVDGCDCLNNHCLSCSCCPANCYIKLEEPEDELGEWYGKDPESIPINHKSYS